MNEILTIAKNQLEYQDILKNFNVLIYVTTIPDWSKLVVTRLEEEKENVQQMKF